VCVSLTNMIRGRVSLESDLLKDTVCHRQTEHKNHTAQRSFSLQAKHIYVFYNTDG